LGLTNSDPNVDVHLTEIGITQIEELSEKLKSEPIEHIYISPLRRTKQTADIINKYHNVEVEADELLGDISTGYEGQSSKPYFDALDESEDRWNARFNDGESLEDVKKRVSKFIIQLKTKSYKSVLIVTSRDVVSAFYCIANKLTNEQAWSHHVDKGSCLEVEI
jgi:broad specificity phosphatase PhoE